jgi:hypothetical protein
VTLKLPTFLSIKMENALLEKPRRMGNESPESNATCALSVGEEIPVLCVGVDAPDWGLCVGLHSVLSVSCALFDEER